jgi:hypothetical protein
MGNTGWTEEEAFDWDAAEKANEPLDIAIYGFDVVKAEAVKSSSGNPMLKLELKAVEKIGEGDINPRKVFDNVPCTNKAAARLLSLAASAGIDRPRTSGYGELTDFVQRLVDAGRVYAKVKHEEYNGRTNAKIDYSFLTREAAEQAAELMAGNAVTSGGSEEPRRRRTA